MKKPDKSRGNKETAHRTLIVIVSKWVCSYGPSDRIRTCGILLPKQARYQLRYTRINILLINNKLIYLGYYNAKKDSLQEVLKILQYLKNSSVIIDEDPRPMTLC